MNSRALPVALFCLGLCAPSAAAQGPPTETKLVLRVSRAFLADLTGRTFTRDEPINTMSSGAAVEGSAHIDGRFNVKLYESQTETAFDLLVGGDVFTQVAATRRPVQVYLSGRAPFQARRRIDFTGTQFVGQAVEVTACYHSDVDQLCSFRGGLVGAVTRRVARPIVLRTLPEGDRSAGDQIRTQVADSFRDESDKVLPVLNEVVGLAHKGVDLLRRRGLLKGELPLQHASTADYLAVGIGPHDQPLADLPAAFDLENVPVELWVRRPKHLLEKVAALELFEEAKKHWRAIKPDVLARLTRRAPELAATLGDVLDHVQAEAVGPDWYVIRFARGLSAVAPK